MFFVAWINEILRIVICSLYNHQHSNIPLTVVKKFKFYLKLKKKILPEKVLQIIFLL